MEQPEIILCACGSPEHQVIFIKEEEQDWKEVYLEIHLTNNRNFFERLWYGLKYAFGYKCRYGAWDEIILNKDHADQLQSIVNHLRSGKKSDK